MQECRSPESCIYAVGVLGEGGRIHQRGSLEVTPSRLIYTPDDEEESYIWPLRYLIRYSYEADKFTMEAGAQCPFGAGLYTFATEHASELHRIVARNTTTEVTSPKHSMGTAMPTTDSQTTPHPPPSFPPPSPPLSSSPYSQRYNDAMSPQSHPHRRSGSSLSPSPSPTLSRSPSVRSLPENAFEVKNIGDNQSISQDGILEVTSQELIYSDNSSQQRIVWPLMFLRRYGCSENVFSIEAGRRCPGGEGYYSFSTPRIAELYELVQSYAKNLYSSQMSLFSMDQYPSPSSVTSPPSHNPQLSYSQPHTPSPGSGDRSESPVFQRSDSFIRRAFSAMELRKNVFEVHNLGDNQQEVGKGILEVTSNDLIYIDSATGEKWRWPIKFLRRYGCNGVRVFSFEAGRRCPGGEGLYAFSTSRASEIHEAIVESINTNRGGQMQLGNLSMSRLSLADAAMTGSTRNGGWSRKFSAPVVSQSNHTHFLTPPPMRKPSQPTLDENPSSSYPPRTSTPTTTPTRRSLSSDETDAGTIEGVTSAPPTNPPLENKPGSLPNAPIHHTYDLLNEVKDEYLRHVENESDAKQSKNGDQAKSGQKKKKVKPKPPPRYKGSPGQQRNSRLSTSSQTQDYKQMNGYTTPMADSQSSDSIPSSPYEQDKEGSFYQNIQLRSLPKAARSNGTSSSLLSNSFTNGNTHSVVPQPNSGADPSLYENLTSYRRSRSDTPPSSVPQPDSQQSSLMYANLADFKAELESARSNSTSSESRQINSVPSSPNTLASSSYTEIEIVHSAPPTSPDNTAWSPSSLSQRRRESALNGSTDSTNGGRILPPTSAAENNDVIYNALDFTTMTSLPMLRNHHGDKQTFADLLERHSAQEKVRDTSGSRKKK